MRNSDSLFALLYKHVKGAEMHLQLDFDLLSVKHCRFTWAVMSMFVSL